MPCGGTHCWGPCSCRVPSWPRRWAGLQLCGRAVTTWWQPWRWPWRSVSPSVRWALGARWSRTLWVDRASQAPQTHSASWKRSVWWSGCRSVGRTKSQRMFLTSLSGVPDSEDSSLKIHPGPGPPGPGWILELQMTSDEGLLSVLVLLRLIQFCYKD